MAGTLCEFAPARVQLAQTTSSRESRCGEETCRPNALHFICEHGSTLRSVSRSGIVQILIIIAFLSVGITSWALAHNYSGLTYGVIGACVVATTTVLFWRAPAQRRSTIVQASATFVVVGIALFSDLKHKEAGLLCACSLIAAVGLVLGVLCDNTQGLRGVFRISVITASVFTLSLAPAAVLAGFGQAEVFVVSSVGLALMFVSSFGAEAVVSAFNRRVSITPWIRFQRRLPPMRVPDNRRWTKGLLGVLDAIGVVIAKALNECLKGVRLAVNRTIDGVVWGLRLSEFAIRLVVIRIAQILNELGRCVNQWARLVWPTLRGRVPPNLLATGGFASGAIFAAIASKSGVDYVGANQGFSSDGWSDLGSIAGIAALVALSLIVAWSAYGDSIQTGFATVVPQTLFIGSVGAVIVGFGILAAVVGLPAIEFIPVAGNLVSHGPYTFGPASAIVTAGFASLVLYLAWKAQSTSSDVAPIGEGFRISEWLRLLPGLVQALSLHTLLPSLAVVVGLSILGVFAPSIVS